MSRVGEVTHRGSGVCFQVSLSNTGLMSAWLMFSYLLLKKKKKKLPSSLFVQFPGGTVISFMGQYIS